MGNELYSIHPVSEQLRPFVRRFLYADQQSDLTIRPAPTGYIYLGNSFGSGTVVVSLEGGDVVVENGWHVAGQVQSKELVVRHDGHLGHILAEFTPTGFYRLLKIPGNATINIYGILSTFSPSLGHAFDGVYDGHESQADRLRKLDGFLCDLIPAALPESDLVAWAAAALEESNGSVRVSALCAELGVGERQLHRSFQHVVGLSPKYFGRVRQINYALEMLMTGNVQKLTMLAQEGGFYDQAHFIHTMHHFFDEGPQKFLASRYPLLMTFLAKSRYANLAALPASDRDIATATSET